MRYIKVEDAIKVADKECGEFRGIFARIKERLEAMPTADVMEVVRCKNCKWFNDFGCAIRIVDESDKPKEDDFCSWGERRDERRMTEVYRRVAIGQSGNEGVEYTKVAEFETEEEARDFCNKQTDTNGWVDYVVVCRDMDKER